MPGGFSRKARCVGIALFLLYAGTNAADAHPHVWIDMKTSLGFDATGRLDALTISWTFDEFYSAFAVQDFKKRNDGSYDPADLEKLAEVNLANLKEWNYFTEMTANGAPVALGTATSSGGSFDPASGQLTMTFTLSLARPVAATEAAPVRFRVYDPSYYIAIDYMKDDPIRLAAGTPDGCAVSTAVPSPEKIWASLPESAFMGSQAVSLGKNFATTATLICKRS